MATDVTGMIDPEAHWQRYPEGDPCWNNPASSWSGPAYRTDLLPTFIGLYAIEDTHHQIWVVNGDLVFELGNGEGQEITPAVCDLIGPWRLYEDQVIPELAPEVRR